MPVLCRLEIRILMVSAERCLSLKKKKLSMFTGTSNLMTLLQAIGYIGLVLNSFLTTRHCQVHTGSSMDSFTFNCTAMTMW